MGGFSVVDWAEVLIIGLVIVVGLGGILKVITTKDE